MPKLLRIWTSNQGVVYSRSVAREGFLKTNPGCQLLTKTMSLQNSLLTKLISGPRALLRYVHESYAELKKVAWPSRQTTVHYTIIVAASSVVAGLLIGGIDFLLALALEQLIV